MSFSVAAPEADEYVPSIAITPVLPSRASLPSEMRAILDSIVGPATTRGHHPATDTIIAGGEPFRLVLNLDHARFSVAQVAAALEAACRAVTDHETVGEQISIRDAHDMTSSTPRARPRPAPVSMLNEDALMEQVTDDMSWCTGPVSLDGEDGHTVGRSSSPSCSCNGRGHDPTWRHAIYFNPSVWPAVPDRSKRPEVRKADPRPAATDAHFALRFKSGWYRMKLLARPLGLQVARRLKLEQ
ncbi:hypothetical protein GY45DRAFT_328601 [Cubamyces sp. BRFM 1775]|nr:hypothetical protein GY45DRAFT_328601 [Cubamyces sp. BRFM 1775]